MSECCQEQKKKLAVQGVMQGHVQNAKGTKTLNPRAGKSTHHLMHGFGNDDHSVLGLNLDPRIGWVLG